MFGAKFATFQVAPSLATVGKPSIESAPSMTSKERSAGLRLRALDGYMTSHSTQSSFEQRENTGNIVEYAIRYFHQMADYNWYWSAHYLSVYRWGWGRLKHSVLGAPKAAIMIVDSR